MASVAQLMEAVEKKKAVKETGEEDISNIKRSAGERGWGWEGGGFP